MEYAVVFLEEEYKSLTEFLFYTLEVERAAFLLCNLSVTDRETRFLVKEVIPIQSNELEWQEKDSLGIPSRVTMSALKKADTDDASIIFVHSHPKGYNDYSKIDDKEEYEIFRTAFNRLGKKLHASLLFPIGHNVIGRVWTSDLNTVDISKIKVLGKNKYSIIDNTNGEAKDLSLFDRQILAFGKPMQNLLSKLHVGIVGCGGTGSAIVEQIVRLGVNEITIIDNDTFDKTNVNRVLGSSLDDHGKPKVDIMERLIFSIGLGTKVNKIKANVGISLSATRKLLDCDVIMSCTDDHYGRFILNQIAQYYYIPVIDMGVMIDSNKDGDIKSVVGRVTKLGPGMPCLQCRGRISLETAKAELMPKGDAERLAKQGYAPGLEDKAPAVICFTSAIASLAINELLHLFSGYMGSERTSSEVICRFENPDIRTNNTNIKTDCYFCNNNMGAGDTIVFLGVNWPKEG